MRAWQQWLASAAIVALAPLMMAPGSGGCHVCLAEWQGNLTASEWIAHDFEVQQGKSYQVWLENSSGSSSLDIYGQQISTPTCNTQQGNTLCTFEANGQEKIFMVVTAGGNGASYLLTIGYKGQ